MKMNTHLTFDGQCEEAFRFYQKCLGGTIISMVTWGETPAARQAPPGWEGKIIHATLESSDSGDFRLTGADVCAEQGYQTPQGFSILLAPASAAEAERVFDALSQDAREIRMKLDRTFWAERFGMVVDRFGIPWMVNFEKTRA